MSTTNTASATAWFDPQAALAPWQAMMRKLMAMPKVLDAVQRVRVGATPTHAVYREDNLRLLRYESDVEKRYRTPLLFVFALVNRPYILDLRPGKSVVAQFVNRGFDVYNIDWGVPADGDRYLGLEDYVLRYLDHAVDRVRQRCGVQKISLLGYCMGGTMCGMYAALRPQKVRNLITLTAPFDWSSRDSLLSVWTDEKYFNVDRLVEVYGNVPPHWMQTSFLMLKPVQNLIEKYIGLYENIEDEKFVEDFLAMETWLNDNIPIAGETFRQFVKYCFQKNLLIQGKLEIGDERVDLRRITCPLLNLVAQNDHLVPCGQSIPLNERVGSKDRKTINFPAGHIGMAVSGRAHRELWPGVCDWLAERSEGARS
jgi:polyhydroxyalkanoate synthase